LADEENKVAAGMNPAANAALVVTLASDQAEAAFVRAQPI